MNGKDKKIIEFVKNQEHFYLFFDKITNLFDRMLGGFKDEGKDYKLLLLVVLEECIGQL